MGSLLTIVDPKEVCDSTESAVESSLASTGHFNKLYISVTSIFSMSSSSIRSTQISWLPLLLYSVSVLFAINKVLVVCGRCLEDQRSLFLQLNQSLTFSQWPCSDDPKLVSWNTNTDCCSWKGVTCDRDSGHVIGLDLSGECISGGVENISSTLFNLRYLLQSLNLADNYFNSTPIPSGLDKFVNLTILNLSNAGFGGQVPIEISRLRRLFSLDLSNMPMYERNQLILENPDLRTLVQDLSGLRISVLMECIYQRIREVNGPLDSSLSELSLLSQIDLSQNDLSTEVPIFFENFINLTSLRLSDCGLYGKFPNRVLQLRTLQSLDVSENPLLYGFLPEFPLNGSLIQSLVLYDTSFSGSLPDSIANLSLLSELRLSSCSFNGSIPSSIIELNQLELLDLSNNSFTGPIPPLPETLTLVILSHNMLTGPLLDSREKPRKA
ncbi:receptor-like protein 6 [Macadamia integrifolia]|uniref:receptor-like protein 6 n=1 Tax=Macadamia integrifolia TaxID=60698 RepID=UPI001C5320FB|nr:receptor-like protein 6 [Macadamia integrifolia]